MPANNNNPQATPIPPWHEGEIALQTRIGVATQMAEIGRHNIRPYLPQQHQEFYPLLPYLLLGSVDPQGNVWATIRAGHPGFITSPNPTQLQINTTTDPHDPAETGMTHGQPIAGLGIDLATRRRNRFNGTITRSSPKQFTVNIAQTFGNCPRYIQHRNYRFTRPPQQPSSITPHHTTQLDQHARNLIATADTFFVASYADQNGTRQIDVSHRGGKAGFVRIDADGGLTIPDFSGNLFFNTLGNFIVNPKAGLLFINFNNGDLLQLTGSTELILDSPEIAAFQGAERLWRFMPQQVIHRPQGLPLQWALADNGWSPNALMTGDWPTAAKRLAATNLAQRWQAFRITRVTDESSSVRSIELEPADGAGLIPHQAGQHLPVRVHLPGSNTPSVRSYTLSTAPSDGHYRISVKRDGSVSRYLHALAVGDTLEAHAPGGSFTLNAAEKRPAVLLAAGIGITPMLAMLRHVVFEGLRTRHTRKTWLFRSAHNLASRAFDAEIDALIRAGQNNIAQVRVLTETHGLVQGQHFDHAGRIKAALLQSTLPFADYDFYLCGPPGFMQTLYDELRALNISDQRIHAEAFGPAALQRTPGAASTSAAVLAAAQTPVAVMFTRSGKEARWQPGTGSLLDLAEARGLQPAYGCRSGSCGTCRTKVTQGAVAYLSPPSALVSADEALICCAVPAAHAPGEAIVPLHLAL